MSVRVTATASVVMLLWVVAAGQSGCKDLPAPEPLKEWKEYPIVTDDSGYISGDNGMGIQGRWYAYASNVSEIVPKPLDPFTLRDGKICASGTTAKVESGGFKKYYGAGIGFHLCYSDDDDVPPEFPYTLSECPLSPLSPDLHRKIAGISFRIDTKDLVSPPPEIRVIFKEWRREEGAFVSVRESGEYEALFKNAGVSYDETQPGTDPRQVESILFQVVSTEDKENPFDFCLSKLRLLVYPDPTEDSFSPRDTDTGTEDTDTVDHCDPEHYIDAGLDWIDVPDAELSILKTEVTAAQYKLCEDALCCYPTGDWEICNVDNVQEELRKEKPANCVSWYDARSFCRWAGGRLPTESQWERAALSGREGGDYPWGDGAPTCELAIMDDINETCGRELFAPYEVCTTPDGNTADGVCDMAGNVWEWVDDWYEQTEETPPIPPNTFRKIKGGSYFSRKNALKSTDSSMEHPFNPRDFGRIGFRCVR